MPNRHVPHSAPAWDPKPTKPCAGCSNTIALQPIHRREYAGRPHVRYFNDFFQEICEDCVKRQHGAEHVVAEAHNKPLGRKPKRRKPRGHG